MSAGLFVRDSFSGDVDNTLLTNHIGEEGAIWTKHPAAIYALGVMRVSAAARSYVSNIGDAAEFYASGVPATADVRVTATMRWLSAADAGGGWQDGGIAARVSTVADTQYLLWHNAAGVNGGPRWELYRVVAGGSTLIDVVVSAQVGIDTDYAVMLQARGTALSWSVSGYFATRNVVDAGVAAAGRVALRQYATPSAGTPATGLHISNLTAETVP